MEIESLIEIFMLVIVGIWGIVMLSAFCAIVAYAKKNKRKDE